MGKHHHAAYRRLRLVSSQRPFDLVHCDVWGPVRTLSVSDHRYYIMFIDDFSRVSWVYLLKDKINVLDVIKKFFAEIMNQVSVTPKYLRTDNILKFTQTGIQSYCSSLRIIHHTTCPRTSQQNGMAERKHRHILNVTRTIMLQVNVPKYL